MIINRLFADHSDDKVPEVNDRRLVLLEGALAVGDELTAFRAKPLVSRESSGGVLEAISLDGKLPPIAGAVLAALTLFEAELEEDLRLLRGKRLCVFSCEFPERLGHKVEGDRLADKGEGQDDQGE